MFVRFLEDNRLIDPPKIAGPEERLQQARDEHELFFREHPSETDREYLLSVFDELAKLPGTKDVFGEHNPIRELPNWLSGDAAKELLQFFQKIDANTGELVHDFTDANWDTRFLGDLYQHLSEAARKKYALLQTPEFVEEFILDRTLDPALDEFGLDAPPVKDDQDKPVTEPGFRMIDPACGSGHFLLGAFPRILGRWQKQEPGGKIRDLVQKTLDCIHGVDVNPYAVAIARFRLLLTAMKACGVSRLVDAPAFRFNLACGDSLLHAPLRGGQRVFDWELSSDETEFTHAYFSEHLPRLKRILTSGIYHTVVANPPYIAPKDRSIKEAYRQRFLTCYGQYSLYIPFVERCFQLGTYESVTASGFLGVIIANTFIKADFGKKVIQEFFPKVELTHVIDTAGAKIPGHGTPTMLIFARVRAPQAEVFRVVSGLQGEPTTTSDAAKGLYWAEMKKAIDESNFSGTYVESSDRDRSDFETHPWSLGGGGVPELKAYFDNRGFDTLGELTTSIGRTLHTGCDDAYFAPYRVWNRQGIPREHLIRVIEGDSIRDWAIFERTWAIFPYDTDFDPVSDDQRFKVIRQLWLYKQDLRRRREPNGTHEEIGLTWYEWSRFQRERLKADRSIGFPSIATHNQFAFTDSPAAFNQSCPAVKLANTSYEHFFQVLGILNSSSACPGSA